MLAGGGVTTGAGATGAGATACGATWGGGAGAVGGSACGATGRWAPVGTGLPTEGMVGGTMGVATLAGGIGVVVGNGTCSRWPCPSGGGMTATPDGMDGKVVGSSNFGVSWAGCVS